MWKTKNFHPSNGAPPRVPPPTFCNSLGDLKQRKATPEKWIKYLDLAGDPTIGVGETLNFGDIHFKSLVMLDLGCCYSGEIFGLESLTVLENLDLSSNNLTAVAGLSHLHRLKTLNLRHNNLTGAALDLSGLYSLWHLNMSNNPIGVLPAGLKSSTKLTHLSMVNCNMTDVHSIGIIKSLRSINLKNNDLENLPSLRNLASLVTFTACNNQLESIDFGQTIFHRLRELNLSGNMLTTLPKISAPNISVVHLYGNNIRIVKIPGTSGKKTAYTAGLGWPKLGTLDLTSNQLSSVRLGMPLSVLYLNNNALPVFPIIEDPSCLISLTLKGNVLTRVPDMSSFVAMERLDLANNLIAAVENVSRCPLIELDLTSHAIDYDDLVGLAHGLAETQIKILHLTTIAPGPVPAALGCIKTLEALYITDNGDVPVTLGGLKCMSWGISQYSHLEKEWLQTYYPLPYNSRAVEIIACFGKPCQQAVMTVLICMQHMYQQGAMPYVCIDLILIIFNYWQAKDWALTI